MGLIVKRYCWECIPIHNWCGIIGSIYESGYKWRYDAFKKHCPQCDSAQVKKNGRSRHGKQRWLCKRCGTTYGWKNVASKFLRQKIWFKRWIIEGYTLRQLSAQSGHSRYYVRQTVRYWLERAPVESLSVSECRYVLLDGTFLENRRGLLSVMHAPEYRVFYSAYGLSEGLRDVTRFCTFLRDQGLCPISATIDGNPHLTRVLKTLWPQIFIQRCLVHVQRQGLSWCRRNPKRTDAKHLRQIFLQVMSIRSLQQKEDFPGQIQQWEERFGQAIHQAPESGWVFSDLKRARSMLLSALPNMFYYFQDPLIPTSTNALEGYYSRLKQRYRQHRGLAKRFRKTYFQWYTYLCPK